MLFPSTLGLPIAGDLFSLKTYFLKDSKGPAAYLCQLLESDRKNRRKHLGTSEFWIDTWSSV